MERPMNTASKNRSTLAVIEEHIRNTEKRHTPVSRIKVVKDKKTGVVNIEVFTSRPEAIRMESRDIEATISEQSDGKTIKVTVVPEARAVAKFVRISPRKARFVMTAVKGKRVSEAIDILRFIPNHASEPILKVLKSAAANALDGWGAGADELRVHNIIADGGPILKRIRARAQGRAYRILKRTSHLTVVLLETPAPKRRPVARPKAKAVAAAPVAPKQPAAILDLDTQTASAETSTSQGGESPVEQA